MRRRTWALWPFCLGPAFLANFPVREAPVSGKRITKGLTPAPRAEQRTARSARIPRTAYVAAQVSQVLTSFGPFGFFLAGGLCSSLSHVLATPVDVVKTSQQKARDRHGTSLGMLATALELVKNHGPKKLLSGAGATFTGYFLHGAFKYGLFEVWKGLLRVHSASLAMHIPLLCASAFLAELMATVVLCPAEAARIVILTMFGLNTWLALEQLKNDQGVWNGWFGALVPLLMKQCSYTVAKLVTYDVLSLAWSTVMHPVLARILAAFCAATAATLASQPADTVFTCISVSGQGECPLPLDECDLWEDKPPGIWMQMRDAARRLGIVGLFSGWQTRIFQMMLIVTLQLLLYDVIRPKL